MKTIYKYTLSSPQNEVDLPREFKILHLALQNEIPCLWAEVDDIKPLIRMTVTFYGTGHIVPDNAGNYIGTVLMHDGSLVFHAYINQGPL